MTRSIRFAAWMLWATVAVAAPAYAATFTEPKPAPACAIMTPGAAFMVLASVPEPALARIVPAGSASVVVRGAARLDVVETRERLARAAGVVRDSIGIVSGMFWVGAVPETTCCRTLDGRNGFQVSVVRSQSRAITRVIVASLRDGDVATVADWDLTPEDRLWVRLPIAGRDEILVVQAPVMRAPPNAVPPGLWAAKARFHADLLRLGARDGPILDCGPEGRVASAR
jgi:hypothetical protein